MQMRIHIGRDYQATLQVDFFFSHGQVLADLRDNAFFDQDFRCTLRYDKYSR